MKQLSSYWTNFPRVCYLNVSGKSVEKIQVWLKSDKNNGHLLEGLCAFISWLILLRMRFVPDRRTENQTTHFILSNFFLEDRVVYEIMWKNIVEPGRPQVTIRRMRFACWPTKVTDTHSEYVILTAFLLQLWFRELSSVLRTLYVHCLPCLLPIPAARVIRLYNLAPDSQHYTPKSAYSLSAYGAHEKAIWPKLKWIKTNKVH
jgi:hypothetical protein